MIHTYIIGHYNPSVRIIDLVSHTTYVVCVNFLYISGGTYSRLRTTDLRNFSWQFYLLSEFLPEICRNRFDVWPGTRTLAFRLISQHNTY